MIAKGNLHAHGQKLAAYLITGKMHERAELAELRGFASSNIREAFIDVMIQAEATRCEKPFFHTQVRLPEGDSLDRGKWLGVADRIEQQLGFEGQGRAVAFHHDRRSGETHMHIAWSRIDLEQMRSIDPGLYKNKLKEISRQLEREFGLTPVRNERPEQQKTRAPGRGEEEQSRRLGTDLRATREAIRDCWDRSDNGRSFEAALAEHGFVLARGDRRDFVVIDAAGGDHALSKRITGSAAAETRARLADIDKAHLPSVDQAKAMQAERASVVLAPEAETAGVVPENQPAASPTVAVPPDPGMRDAGDVAGRMAGSILKAIGGLFSFAADLFAPSPPPAPEQQKRDMQAAAERVEFRRFVAEQAQQLYIVNEQQQQREREVGGEGIQRSRDDPQR